MYKPLLFFGLTLAIMSCNNDDDNLVDPCNLDPDPGPCEAFIPKYYFDRTTLTCKEFIWGGCDGVVPFNTMEECESCLNP